MNGTNIQCPCFKCENGKFWNAETVKLHLLKKGFVRDYYVWDRHGEPYVARQSGEQSSTHYSNTQGRRDGENQMYNMVMDVSGPSFDPEMPNAEAQKLYDILKSSERELYEGCETSQLSAMAQMLSLKSDHHWSEACFDQTSRFFKDILPQDNSFLDSFYKVRNVRLGLSADGFQPFGETGRKYSSWPIIVTPYNLPPWMCSKEQYLFLSVLVPGPKNPKQKIDVFLQPLIAELKMLWEDGVETWDSSLKQNFRMRAALMWTISDFPAYSMLSGWKTAGHLACPHCAHDHDAYNLKNGGKTTWFDNHRKILPSNRPFRKNKNWFTKGKTVTASAPPVRIGEDAFQEIEALGLMKVTELGSDEHNARIIKAYNCGWKKRSIFWDLSYWRTLSIRHNLDVMHVEKNVFENIFNTIMAIEGKTKDNSKARDDIAMICRRPELAIDELTRKYPKACYSLDKKQKQKVCEWLKDLKFPDGYVSNMGRCINMMKYKLFGMKSYDCHVFMQRLLPIAFREFLPNNVWEAVTELSLFFRDLTSTTMRISDMRRLEEQIPVILCKLERIFPPSLFDSMEHLLVHLPYEARIAGPVQYRWMYPFERFLRHLKNNVKNKAQVEGSICNAFLVEEASTFCSHYFKQHVQTKHRKVPRNDSSGGGESFGGNISIFSHPGRSHGSVITRYLDDREYMAAHNYILFNCPEVAPYTEIFINQLREHNPYITSVEVDRCLESEFAMWFKHYAQNPSQVLNEYIRDISFGPLRSVKSVPVYYVNGYKFHTRVYGANRSTFNSGVCIKGSNFSEASNDYFGIVEEILIIEYPHFPVKKTVLFKCDWFDPTLNTGTRIHPRYNIVEVNKRKRLSVYEPFVLAMQAMQVYFCNYPSLKKDKVDWLVVCKVKARPLVDLPQTPISHQEPFQDDIPTHLNDISTNDIPTHLNDENGVEIDLDDDDGTPDEEMEYESEEDGSSQTDDSNNCEDNDDSSE
ncbi:uncharacterized protein LOC141696477 [Apium graveolens]|uniref:uncharacterized protein LOC141696477 n=1 Tax=Apium graveolens TaxID=4045 RepID=UPI003D78CF1C